MAGTRISVIIPVLNGASVIEEQLTALADQTYGEPWELLVVDNGSTDGTRDVVASWSDRLPGLRIVDAPHKRRHTVARNAGAAAATGDVLVYCDADDAVGPGWLAAYAAAFCDGCDFAGGPYEDLSLNRPGVRSWHEPPDQHRLPDKMDFLPLALSANLAVRASVLRSVGGWDENYAQGCNDVEMSWRIQLSGRPLVFVPDALIAYRYRSTLRGLALQAYRRGLAEPQLYRDYRPRGVPRRPYWRGIAGAVRVVVALPTVLRAGRPRARWVIWAATLAGRARGSVRHRTLYL
jgi:glycosyltransferase involved in cell wall biosynthesis